MSVAETTCLNLHHVNDPHRQLLRADVPGRAGATFHIADLLQSNMRIDDRLFVIATEFPCGTFDAMTDGQTQHIDIYGHEFELAVWFAAYQGTILYTDESYDKTELWELGIDLEKISINILFRPPLENTAECENRTEFYEHVHKWNRTPLRRERIVHRPRNDHMFHPTIETPINPPHSVSPIELQNTNLK